MTVEIAVDDTVRSGSSVIEVRLRRQPRILPETLPVVPKVIGEAVFVDLGRGRNVIALLASGPNGSGFNYPDHIVPELFHINTLDDRELAKITSLRGRRDIPERYLPTFVTFADLNDPKSARVVKPDEFSQVFGAGAHLKGVWIEMTSEAVTNGIENRFPWWNGPLPWLRPLGNGAYLDTRGSEFRWQKEMLKRSL